MKHNPFAFYGKKMLGGDPNFIGRKAEISYLWERAVINGAFTQIVGLPRMGKSSLIKNCFETPERREFLTKNNFLYIVVDNCASSAIAFWKIFADKIEAKIEDELTDYTLDFILSPKEENKKESNICKEKENCYYFNECKKHHLTDTVLNTDLYIYKREQISNIYKNFQGIEDLDVFHERLCDWLESIKALLGYSIIFVIDEFDSFSYPEAKDSYIKLRELASHCTIVTVSRRPIEVIEKNAGCKPYLYNLHETPLYINEFSENDIDNYWNHFRQEFPLDAEQFISYKLLVDDDVGKHPHLMNMLNYYGYQNMEDILNSSSIKRREIEKQLRVEISKVLPTQMKYLEEQDLSEVAKQILIGNSLEGLADKITLLENYSFVKLVDNSIKDGIFNSTVGPVVLGTKSYIAFSKLATCIFYEQYSNSLPFADILQNTEIQLRNLIKNVMRNNLHYGVTSFDIIRDDFFNDPTLPTYDYEEVWENILRRFLARRLNHNQMDKWENTLVEAKKNRIKQLKYEIASSPSNRCLVDFMTIGQLWYLFFDKLWNLFSPILGESNKMVWYKNRFEEVQHLRNAKDHYQMDYVSENKRDQGIDACNDICIKINAYLS